MIRRPPRSTLDRSSAASDVYKRQEGKGPNRRWGSNADVLNHALILGAAHEYADPAGQTELVAATSACMDHLLGQNPLGWSFVTGYGRPGTTCLLYTSP